MSQFFFLLLTFQTFYSGHFHTLVIDPSSSLAYSPDGRLALSMNGNIWLMEGEQLTQLTFGKTEDREPSWTSDGKSLVFSSNRNGVFDLWQLSWNDGKVQEPTLFLQSRENDRQPHFGKDGTLAWTRGDGADANIWIKRAGEEEFRLTRATGGEHSPAISPDGTRIVYIAERKGKKELRLRYLNSRRDDLIDNTLNPEYPAWSPDGKRISFSSRGNTAGIWITTPDGNYKNFLSSQRAVTA